MKNKSIIHFFKKPFVIIIVIFIGAGGVGYAFFRADDTSTYDFVVVERGNLIQEVSVTGRVKPAESVNLGFERSGKVAWVKGDVGDRVFTGQVLVRLANSAIEAQLLQAKAKVKAQDAKLEELLRGSRIEEIEVQKVKVENAKIALEEAKRNLTDKLHEAYTKSDDAIRNKTDQFFSNPRGSNPQIDFVVADAQLEIDIEFERLLIESILTSWKLSLDDLTLTSDLATYITRAKKNLDQIKSFLGKVAFIVNALEASANLTQTTIDGYKSDVITARNNVNTVISNISAAEEKLKSAQSTLTLAEQELILKKAGTVAEQIKAQEANVEDAEAGVKNYEAQLSETIIRAPISGVITIQKAKIGEIIAANALVVSLISTAEFEIEANVPEADIARIEIRDIARVTLDAYGNDVEFEVQVVSIDPAETIIEGVTTYKITLQFVQKDERIKSGMTANIDILTDERENIIAVPQRSVIKKDGEKTVRILDGEEIREVKVKTGLRGSDGAIEITEGISEGDKVITFVEE